jgi:membrane associated rhomboid family serine protease
MGSLERNYPDSRHDHGEGRLTPVVKWLLILNVGLYLTDLLFLDHAMRDWGMFTVATGLQEGRVWELFTFQFLHGSVGHILANSIGLYFFGPWMERWWGSARFIVFYLLCGVAGALFYTFLMMIGVLERWPTAGLVGASAGLYGILIGVAQIAPALQVRLLFPPITLTMRQLAIAVLVIAAGAVILKIGGNEGGEAGHLGGAILGFLLVRFPQSLQWVGGLPKRSSPRPRVQRETKLRPRTRVQLAEDDEVDRILDKISQHGFQSLTDAERDVLRKAAEAKSNRP